MFAMTVNKVISQNDNGCMISGYPDALICSLKISQTVYDGCGNSFIVKDIDAKDSTVSLSAVENSADIPDLAGKLLTDSYDTAFLFCRDPLRKYLPDFDYEAEYNCCDNRFLFDYDGFVNGEEVRLPEADSKIIRLIYRGWMMKPQKYEQLYKKLLNRGCVLINSPLQYSSCHTLPGWYDNISDITPKSVWSEDISDLSVTGLIRTFGEEPVMIKDYVKSRKHEWYEACFIPDASDTAHALKVIHNFIDRQGDSLTGGLVIRKYVSLASIGLHPQSKMPLSQEYRAFFLYNKLICIINYWDGTPAHNKELEKFLKDTAKRINSNFFSVDAALKADGNMTIMEVGDGQVSGLQDHSEAEFYESVFRII